MANNYGKLYFVTFKETSTANEESYYTTIATALTHTANKILGGSDNYEINAYEVSLSRAKEILGKSLDKAPSVFYIVNDTKKVFLLQGIQSQSAIESFFTAIFYDKIDKGGQSNEDNGGKGTFGLPMRPCIPFLDDSLEWLLGKFGLDAKTIATYKKYALLGGSGLLAFGAFNSVKRVGQIGYGAGAAALAYLALADVDPNKPCQ